MQYIVKFFSRKLLVLLIASFALFHDDLSGEQWLIAAGMYLGMQGVVDSVQARMKPESIPENSEGE